MTCQPAWSMQTMRLLQFDSGGEEQNATGFPSFAKAGVSPCVPLMESSCASQTAVKTLLRSADAWGAFTSTAAATSPIFHLLFMCVAPSERQENTHELKSPGAAA